MNFKTTRICLFFILTILAGLIFYSESIARIFTVVTHREGSSHGLFVPFLAAYFVWLKWDSIKTTKLQTGYPSIVLMLIGLICPILNLGTFHIQFISFIIFVSGAIYLTLGQEMFKRIVFPVFFLVTMTPIPETIYEGLANYSRHIAFSGSLEIISFLGIPYFKEGWLIHLHNAILEVAISCSGIRYLISYFVFGIAYAYITREKNWQRVSIVILTIPVSHFASIWRLTIIFVMTHYFGPFWSQHRPHVFLSWAVFAAVLLVTIAIDQWLLRRKEGLNQGERNIKPFTDEAKNVGT